jgi:hypothetical protein
VLIAFVQFFVKLLSVSPEKFPWWFFASVNIYCYVMAVYMIIMGGCRLLGCRWQETLFIMVFVYGLWLTPNLYKSTISMMPVTLFICFEFPTYLLAVAIYWFSSDAFGKNKKDWLMFGVIYLVLSLNTETFLMSIPVLFTGIIVVHAIQERYSIGKTIGQVGYLFVLSLVSVVFTWTQPGYHLRPLNIDFHIPSFLEVFRWYLRVMRDYGFSPIVEHLPGLARYIRFLPLFFVAIVILGLWAQRKNNFQANSLFQIKLLLLRSVWALTLMVGFLFCMIPLLFTDYYPYYVTIYPTLLMSIALAGGGGLLVQLFMPETIRDLLKFSGKSGSLGVAISLDEKTRDVAFFSAHFEPGEELQLFSKNWRLINHSFYLSVVKWIGASVILLSLFAFITIPSFKEIERLYRVELIVSAIRADFQEKIVSVYYKTGQKNYFIKNCPGEIVVDQFWGVNGYLYWKGINGAFGVVDTDGNLHGLPPQEVWPDKELWFQIDCLRLTPEQTNYLRP